MKKFIPISIIVVMFGIITLFVLSQDNDDIYSLYDLEGKSTVEMVEHLESIVVNPNILMAGINATHLMLTTEDGTTEYEVPSDIFYLSFAPYIENTHPCGTHNLTTCRGEMKNETFDVYIESSDGTVLFDGSVTTEYNGFAGIWLERDHEATITVTYGELSATGTIATFSDSYTCLTTLQLEDPLN